MTDLTARQAETLAVVRGYVHRHHRMPTRRAICEALGLRSTSAAASLVERLLAKGALVGSPRSYRLADVQVLLVGAETVGRVPTSRAVVERLERGEPVSADDLSTLAAVHRFFCDLWVRMGATT